MGFEGAAWLNDVTGGQKIVGDVVRATLEIAGRFLWKKTYMAASILIRPRVGGAWPWPVGVCSRGSEKGVAKNAPGVGIAECYTGLNIKTEHELFAYQPCVLYYLYVTM